MTTRPKETRLLAITGWRDAGAFTIIELLVAMVILGLLVGLLASAIGQAGSIWRSTRGKTESFQEARSGFERISRNLAQATLNQYWDYDSAIAPTRYERRSELRFACGPTEELLSSTTVPRPGHGIFFCANLGSTDTAGLRGLNQALNVLGYFIEYGGDSEFRPPFLSSPERRRFRLLEMLQPIENARVYANTSGNSTFQGNDWFASSVTAPPALQPTRVVAENVIIMVLLPMLSESDEPDPTKLAPRYRYRSDDPSYAANNGANNSLLNTRNQLPPLVRLAMVAIDEPSAKRLENGEVGNLPTGLFSSASSFSADLYADPAQGGSGNSLEQWLINKRMNYRIFVADVPIAAAKWSREQTN